MITVKRGDTHSIYWTVNLDLTGATVALRARKTGSSAVDLAVTVTDAEDGEIRHILTGELPVGEHLVEAEILLPDGQVVTAPSNTYAKLLVIEDLG
jgi:hypothetical protein